jgi:hypothetical protein
VALEIKKKHEINPGLIILFGLIILIGAVIIYLFILKGVFGNYTAAELLPNSDNFRKIFVSSRPRAAVLYSKYTENMLPSGNSWLTDNISTWKNFLSSAKVDFDIISDKDIETGKHHDYSLLILPGSKSLSEKEVIQIKKYIDYGGSIFATSGTASYSHDGKWKGWDFFSEVFGSRFTKEIVSTETSVIHTLRGNLPVTANIPAGYPLNIAVWDKPMAVEVLDPRVVQVSFWYNYKLEDGLVREGIKKSSGIIYGQYGSGRFVWMGFDLNSVSGVQENHVNFEKLFNNCINWLIHRPLAYLKDWPAGYDAAAVISAILSDNIYNIRNLINILKSNKINATFFIEPDRASGVKNLLNEVAQLGEIAAVVDVGYLASFDDTLNKLNDYITQFNSLKESKKILEGIINRKVTGILPYHGLFDNNTINAAIEAEFNYVLTDSLTDRSIPKLITKENGKLTVITKTARDDYEVIRDFGLTQNEFQYYTYQEDIDRVLFESGLYLLKMHTDFQLKQENINVVNELVKDLKEKNFWITTAAEIQDWTAKKQNIELRIDKRGNRRVALTVYNPGVQTADNISVVVDLNESADKVTLETEIIGTRKVKIRHKKGDKIIELFIDELKSRESRTYYIDYEISNA